MFILFLLYLYGILILFYHTVCKRLDKSFYLNKEDFEVEYEVTDPKAYKHITRLLTSLNIPIRKTENKVQRFYNEWRKKRSV